MVLIACVPQALKLLPIVVCVCVFFFLVGFIRLSVMSGYAKLSFVYFSGILGLSAIILSCLGFIYYLFSFYMVKGYEMGFLGNFFFAKSKQIFFVPVNFIFVLLSYFPLIVGFVLIRVMFMLF